MLPAALARPQALSVPELWPATCHCAQLVLDRGLDTASCCRQRAQASGVLATPPHLTPGSRQGSEATTLPDAGALAAEAAVEDAMDQEEGELEVSLCGVAWLDAIVNDQARQSKLRGTRNASLQEGLRGNDAANLAAVEEGLDQVEGELEAGLSCEAAWTVGHACERSRCLFSLPLQEQALLTTCGQRLTDSCEAAGMWLGNSRCKA